MNDTALPFVATPVGNGSDLWRQAMNGSSSPGLTRANMDDMQDYHDFYKTAQFVTGMVCYPILCAFGIAGNVFTLIVLRHRKMQTSTNVFLRWLAVADTIKLLNDVLYFVNMVLMFVQPKAANNMMGHMYPFSHYILNAAVCVSAWLTVSVAFERYVCVCHPTRAKDWCTIRNAGIASTFWFVLMGLIAVPSALRYQGVVIFNNDTNATEYMIDLTDIGRNKPFMDFYLWAQNLLRSIIPLVILLILNVRIICELFKQRIKGKKMTSRHRITMMLLSVIIVFIVCIFPDAIMSTVLGFGYVDGNYLQRGLREISDTLLTFNSAVNFVIYCACSKAFRDTFVDIFCADLHRSSRAHVDENQTRLLSEKRDVHGPATLKHSHLNGQQVTTEQGVQTYV